MTNAGKRLGQHETRQPRAFALDDIAAARVTIEAQPDFVAEERAPAVVEAPRAARLFRLASFFWAALGLLGILYVTDAGWNLVQSFAARAPWMGQAVSGLLAIVALIFLLFLLREIIALFRMRRVARLRALAGAAIAQPESEKARAFVADLAGFYRDDPGSAAGRAEISRTLGEIHDAPTLIAIAERALLKPKDDEARNAIAEAAQRVSLVTALSPRALVDVAFVLAQSIALVRKLSAIYGGRASGFGLMRLVGRVLSHLAVTGGVAVADEALSQFLGAGLAARLSARLGEGVLNGVLTARVGIAAIELCRPMNFFECPPVKLSEVAKISVIPQRVAEKPAV